MAAALDLFSKYGTSVGVDRIIAQAGVAKATFYRHFPSKEDLVVAFLADRELLWLQRPDRPLGETATPGDRLLGVFDALDAWFQREDFEGSSTIRALKDSHGRPGPVTDASLAGLAALRGVMTRLAGAAGAADPHVEPRLSALSCSGPRTWPYQHPLRKAWQTEETMAESADRSASPPPDDRRSLSVDDLSRIHDRDGNPLISSPHAVLIADDQGRYLGATDAALALLEYDLDVLCGKTVADLTAPNQKDLVDELWARFAERSQDVGYYVVQTGSGRNLAIRYEARLNALPGVHTSHIEPLS